MAILNYTTKIDAYKTVTEIQQILSRHGAKKIVMDNDERGQPVSITFVLEWNGLMAAFQLPCNFAGVLRAMKRDKKVPRSACTEDQARRVGWRIVKDWIEAQMAIVQAELATVPEVFLPYAVTKHGDTLYQRLGQDNQLLLTNPAV